MKIRVLSDLHLECDEPEVIPHAQADLIVLAGDIHNHAEGIRWAAETFADSVPIVYVPGNHEYYDGEFGALEVAMRDAASSVEHVHYLNNAALVDPGGRWRVLGTTLWTDFELFGASSEAVDASIAAAGLGRRAIAADLESRLGVTHTARTLRLLRRRFPRLDLVWLMGADNLAQISRWWRWTGIFKTVRVAVFDRSPYSYKALAACAAQRFSSARVPAKALWRHGPPAWSYVAMRRHPASACAAAR